MMHLDTAGSRCLVASDNLFKVMKLFTKLGSLNIGITVYTSYQNHSSKLLWKDEVT